MFVGVDRDAEKPVIAFSLTGLRLLRLDDSDYADFDRQPT
jgi:hypothetical protein